MHRNALIHAKLDGIVWICILEGLSWRGSNRYLLLILRVKIVV